MWDTYIRTYIQKSNCCRPDTDWYGQSDIETRQFRNPNIPLVVNGVIVTYKINHQVNEESSYSSECTICLGEFEDGEVCRLLSGCKHQFHRLCIDQWLLLHGSCPLCPRSSVVLANQIEAQNLNKVCFIHMPFSLGYIFFGGISIFNMDDDFHGFVMFPIYITNK